MKIGRLMRKMNVRDNDILLIKEGSELAKREVIDSIANSLDRIGKSNVLVLVVDDFEKIRVTDEKLMNKMGWFRLEHLRKFIRLPEKVESEDEKPAETPTV